MQFQRIFKEFRKFSKLFRSGGKYLCCVSGAFMRFQWFQRLIRSANSLWGRGGLRGFQEFLGSFKDSRVFQKFLGISAGFGDLLRDISEYFRKLVLRGSLWHLKTVLV